MKIWEKSAQAEGTASAELLVREMQKKRPVWPEQVGGEQGRGSDKCRMIKVLGGPAGVRISFFFFFFQLY